MSEQQHTEPEARIWATSTDLAGTNMQRKRYYLCIEDGGTRKDVELVIGPGPAISVEPFVVHELNYTVHDFCKHDDDYCVLDDLETSEFEELRILEAHAYDVVQAKEHEGK